MTIKALAFASTERKILNNEIIPGRFLCPHCQRFPGLTSWMIRPDPNKVRPLIVTKREYPHHRWEPVFIGTRDDPLYTEEMSWEGKQDKMTQVRTIFLVLPACIKNMKTEGLKD
jgi:hypothetical protein